MSGLISAQALTLAATRIFRTATRSLGMVGVLTLFSHLCFSQSYPGYHSSSYTGVYGILTNPADILNHRFRADINLVGFFTQVGNNQVTFKYHVSDGENNASRPDPIKRPGRLNFNTDIFGPSIMLRLSDKHAFAITTRARLMANVNGIGANLLNLTIQDSVDQSLIKANLAVSDISARVHGWTELALTYSRQIAVTDYGVWKAGISLKYLGGLGAFFLNTNKLSFTYDDSLYNPTTNQTNEAVTNVQGSISLGYTKNIDSLNRSARDYLSFKNPGVGIDIGVNYEYRDEMQVYETSYSEKTLNYIWRIGASITDIGFIRYNKQPTGGFTTRFSGNTFFTNDLNPPSDSSSVEQMSNYYKRLFNARSQSSAITMQLPTALHLTYDRFFNRWAGIQAQLNVPIMFSALTQYSGTYNPMSISVTPRAETVGFGVYLPLSYNTISGFQAGLSLRLGPLIIGSGSILNLKFLNRTKGGDAYFILRVPIFGYREYKEKVRRERTHLSKRERRLLGCPTK